MEKRNLKLYKKMSRKLIPHIPETMVHPNKKRHLIDKYLAEEAEEEIKEYKNGKEEVD